MLFGALPLYAGQISAILNNIPTLDPNLTAFPQASLIDASSRLDAPAGKNGFISAKGGHFSFANGQRARFFGVNLAKESVFIDHAQIDTLAAAFARAGINLVRIHQIDDSTGILSTTAGQYFVADKLDKVDYWIAKLKERGIYVCLDLNDYRTFHTSENVQNGEALGRGAKPYAVFNQHLISLQLEYAYKFLVEHINPYTGLSYSADPAVAMLEIYDENGLFIRRGDWQNLQEPYKTELLTAWNSWLKKKYISTENMRTAWSTTTGKTPLAPTERLEDNTVRLPSMGVDTALNLAFTDPLNAPGRQSDGALFAKEKQTDFLQTMMVGLHQMGVRVPITAVGAQDILPDLMATAELTDYIGINYYWDHPLWDEGKDWTLPAYFAMNNPLCDNVNYSFPVIASQARMQGKPLVVRELGYCYPNPYRGVGMIEAAAYGAFLDLDAIFLFTYGADSTARTIGYFDVHLDPLRWGLVEQASRLFLSGEVQPAQKTVAIGYSPVDAFTWYQYQSNLYQLAFTTRVVNYTPARAERNPFDLLIASGRSSGSDWSGEKLLLYANNRHDDLHFHDAQMSLLERNGYELKTGRSGEVPFVFHGMGFDANATQSLQVWPSFSVDDIMANNLMPVASYQTAALGFLDPKRRVLGFQNLRDDVVLRMAVDALHTWSQAPMDHTGIDHDLWVTDTRQITRDMNNQLLAVESPMLVALAGKLVTGPATLDAIHFTSGTKYGTFTAETLDNKPFAESGSVYLKMTSSARNDMLQIAPALTGPKPQRLTTLGSPPISTDGRQSTAPTRVEVDGKLLIELLMQNGTWEYLTEPDRALLYTDTGGISVNLPAKPKLIHWYTGKEIISYTPDTTRLTVPEGIRLTEIIWDK